MSWWTSVRNAVESVASLAGNYVLPGSSLVTDQLVSRGSQKQLGSTFGQLAQFGTGMAGAGIGESVTGVPSSPTGGWSGAMNSMGIGGGTASDFPTGGMSMVDPSTGAAYSTTGALQDSTNNPAWLNQFYATQGGSGGVGGPVSPPNTPWGSMMQHLGNGFSDLTGLLHSQGMTAAGSAAGAMPWGSPGNLLSMGSGIYGLMQGEQMKKLAAQYAAQADPFAQYRPGYATQLNNLMANPSSIQNVPGYSSGLEAIQRSMAAQGYQGSGNMMSALSNYGGNFYNTQLSNLEQLSGANANPAAAGQIGLQGASLGNSLTGQSLGSLGYGAYMASPASSQNNSMVPLLALLSSQRS